jgi:streptogramin lyase
MRALLGLVVLTTAATILVGRSLATAFTENAAHATSGRRPRMCAAAIPVGGVPTDVVAAPDAVWVATGLGGIVRVDPSTNEVVARIRPSGSVTRLAHGLGAVWALDLFGDRLLQIDPRANRVVRSMRVGPLPSAVSVGHRLIWVASQLDSTVAGIDPRDGQVVKLARFARGELWPGALAVGPFGVWVVTAGGNEVSVFDPETMTFRQRLAVPGARTLATAGREAWIGVKGGTLLRVRNRAIAHIALRMRGSGYGPSLAARGRIWVAEGGDVLGLDPSSGTVRLRIHLPRGTNAGPIAAGRDLWVVDGARRAILRLRPCERA